MRIKRSWILFLLFCWLCPVGVQPQTSYTDRIIYLKPGKATLQNWMQWIEQQQGITLSYNTSLLNLDEQITLREADTLTVTQLLACLMPSFHISIQESSANKLLLQITPRKSYQLTGNIKEKETGEKLNDAYVTLMETTTGKAYTALTENGLFCLNMLEGNYKLKIHYMGYHPVQQLVVLNTDKNLNIPMTPQSIELKETTVRPDMNPMELDESLPTNKLVFTNANLFS